MVLPLIAGMVARGAATRLGASFATRQVAGFGASALASSAQSKYQQHGQQSVAPASAPTTVPAQQPTIQPQQQQAPRRTGWDYGATGWIKHNPGEFAVASTFSALTGRSLAERNTPTTSAILNRAQF